MVKYFLVNEGILKEVEAFENQKLNTENAVENIHIIKLYGYSTSTIGYSDEAYEEDFDYDIFEYQIKGNVLPYQLKLLAKELLESFNYSYDFNNVKDFSKNTISIKDKILLSFAKEECYNDNIYRLRQKYENDLIPLFTEKERVLLTLPTNIIEDCLKNLKINFKDFSFRHFSSIESYLRNLNDSYDEVDEWGFEF